MDEQALTHGEAWDAFTDRFRAFLRPTDCLLAWGHFPLGTLAKDGLRLEQHSLDIRPVVGNVLRRRTGTVEESMGNFGLAAPAACGSGRGGVRLANLCAVVERLCGWPRP